MKTATKTKTPKTYTCVIVVYKGYDQVMDKAIASAVNTAGVEATETGAGYDLSSGCRDISFEVKNKTAAKKVENAVKKAFGQKVTTFVQEY